MSITINTNLSVTMRDERDGSLRSVKYDQVISALLKFNDREPDKAHIIFHNIARALNMNGEL